NALGGNAYSMDEDDAASAVPLPAAQKIPHGNAGFTLQKWLQMKEIIDSSDVDPDEPRFLIITAKQVTNVLTTTEIKSADYNSVKALSEGRIDTFLGFKVIRTQRLKSDG